jgi:hypothetical protein
MAHARHCAAKWFMQAMQFASARASCALRGNLFGVSRTVFVTLVAIALGALGVPSVRAQAVMGTCTSCSGGPPDPNCGACIASGTTCFNALMPAHRVLGTFMTSDGHDARTLTFGRLIGGAQASSTDINRAVSTSYNGGQIWLYYGTGAPAGYCAPAGGPPPAFPSAASYHFGWEHRFEDTLDGLDCYNAEVDRFYVGVPGHADGSRVCDGEEARFIPSDGAIFDLGGEGNRVVVFPFTDHGPLPCESWEYSVWLSDDPMATAVASPTAPDPHMWNPAVLTTVFLEGWIPDSPAPATEAAALSPDLGNPTQRDGIAQVFALPCGITFRYASIVAGNNGNPTSACAFWSFDAELDAVAGLNEDNTAICPDADGDGHRAASCGGDDCDDTDPMVHPGAFQPCNATRSFNCLPLTPCPMGTACAHTSGLCLTACLEGACQAGYSCNPDGYCEESACAMRTMPCPAGTICRGGNCVDPCTGVTCPGELHCVSGACIDLCLGVTCPAMQVCVANDPGAASPCGPACTCLDLSSSAFCGSRACDAQTGSPTEGHCVDPGCESMTCGAGMVCAHGACIDGCLGVTCPLGQLCQAGACVVDLCANVSCGPTQTCHAGTCVDACSLVTCMMGQRCVSGVCEPDPCVGIDCGTSAHCVEGACVPNGVDAGARDATAGGDSGVHRLPPNMGSCGCRAGSAVPFAPLSIVVGVWLAIARRRRR